MKRTIYRAILSFIGIILFSNSYGQVIDFSDPHFWGKFKLEVDAVRFSKDSIYNSLSGKDIPNKYSGELLFSKYTFKLTIFNNQNKWVFMITQGFLSKEFGKYATQDGFLKSYDEKTEIEHYLYRKNGYDISFQKIASYPDNWIKIHMMVYLGIDRDNGLGKYIVFSGRGDFLYNTSTHAIKQS